MGFAYLYNGEFKITTTNGWPTLIFSLGVLMVFTLLLLITIGIFEPSAMETSTRNQLVFAVFMPLFGKVIYDTSEVKKVGLEKFREKYSGGYLYCLVQMTQYGTILWLFPSAFVVLFKAICGNPATASQVQVVGFMLCFSMFCTFTYLCSKVMINRAVPPQRHSLLLIPIMVCSDIFLELVFIGVFHTFASPAVHR